MADFNYTGNIDVSITLDGAFARDHVYDGDVPVNISFDSGYFGGFYNGNIAVLIAPSSAFSATFSYLGSIAIGVTLDADFDGNFNYSGNIATSQSLTGAIVFNSGVPYSVQASVTIDGESYTNDLVGVVNARRQDNAATTFSIVINSTLKGSTFIDKEVKILFLVSDINGDAVSFDPIFTGKVRGVGFTDGIGLLSLSGYDYSGVHNSSGELVSQDITSVLTGSVLADAVGTIVTGFAPIWGVAYTGSDDIVDGKDYFVNTLNGEIEIPVSSNLIDTPGELEFNYMSPFASLKELVKNIVAIKGWNIVEDGIILSDYSVTTKQPVISISNESIIEAIRKLIELSGAKLDANLFPELRIYSEAVNMVGVNNHIVDETTKYLEDSLEYDIDIDDLITKQTVRSVAKSLSNVEIADPEELRSYSGRRSKQTPYTILSIESGEVAFALEFLSELHRKAIVQLRLPRQGVGIVSFVAGGDTLTTVSANQRSVLDSDWEQSIDGDDIIFTLFMNPILEQTSAATYVTYPGADWTLAVNGQLITYGEGTIEETVEVTGERLVTGVSGDLIGDTYENAYIETAEHAENIVNAMLTESGNFYQAGFVMPLHESANMNIGDKLNIQQSGLDRFVGIIKGLDYSLNTETAESITTVTAKGVGIGI